MMEEKKWYRLYGGGEIQEFLIYDKTLDIKSLGTKLQNADFRTNWIIEKCRIIYDCLDGFAQVDAVSVSDAVDGEDSYEKSIKSSADFKDFLEYIKTNQSIFNIHIDLSLICDGIEENRQTLIPSEAFLSFETGLKYTEKKILTNDNYWICVDFHLDINLYRTDPEYGEEHMDIAEKNISKLNTFFSKMENDLPSKRTQFN